jgi:hypothetical protein
MEKLWSNSLDGEGVILKRGKNDFVCQPSELLFENNGLFHQVCQLNVKVSGQKRDERTCAKRTRLL